MDVDLFLILRGLFVVAILFITWQSIKHKRQANIEKDQAAQWEKETEELLKRDRQALSK